MRRLASLLLSPLLLATASGAAVETVPRRGLRAEVAALLVQGIAGGSLPIAAAVFSRASDGAGGSAELAFLIELPPAPAAASDEGRPLEVYAYAVDRAGEVTAHFAVTLAQWPSDGEGVKLSGSLAVPSGDLSVRFLAWDPTDRRYGMAVRRIALGATAASPRITEECTGWSPAGTEATDLLELTARPVLVSGETRRLAFDPPLPSGSWRVRLVGGVGEAATDERVPAQVVEPKELEWVVPDLPPGVYQLSAALAGGESWTSLPIESWLVPELPSADGGCRRSWGRILRDARAGEPGPGPKPLPPPAGGRTARRLAADYEALLERLASAGDLVLAAGELAELEVPIVIDDPTRTRLLFTAELNAARSLGKRDPRCLLPLIALHAETYRMHHGAGRFSLANHSRRLAKAIAELAVELLAEPEERSLIAVAITGLAEMVATRRAAFEAQRLLQQALSLDEGQQAARLLLAVSYERKGRYDDARRQLEALVSINSAHHEARVRLAILLRRAGEAAAAERLLRAVVAERPPAWLLSLGYQTLAQLLIRDARLGEAVAELEEARRRLPGDQALQLLLAYALDRSGERQAVQIALAELPLGEPAVTSRYRYSDEPPAALGLLRETLRQSVTVRLPVLALALDAESSRGAVH